MVVCAKVDAGVVPSRMGLRFELGCGGVWKAGVLASDKVEPDGLGVDALFIDKLNCLTMSVNFERLPLMVSTDACCRSSRRLMLRTSRGRRARISSSASACACAAARRSASSSWAAILS